MVGKNEGYDACMCVNISYIICIKKKINEIIQGNSVGATDGEDVGDWVGGCAVKIIFII